MPIKYILKIIKTPLANDFDCPCNNPKLCSKTLKMPEFGEVFQAAAVPFQGYGRIISPSIWADELPPGSFLYFLPWVDGSIYFFVQKEKEWISIFQYQGTQMEHFRSPKKVVSAFRGYGGGKFRQLQIKKIFIIKFYF